MPHKSSCFNFLPMQIDTCFVACKKDTSSGSFQKNVCNRPVCAAHHSRQLEFSKNNSGFYLQGCNYQNKQTNQNVLCAFILKVDHQEGIPIWNMCALFCLMVSGLSSRHMINKTKVKVMGIIHKCISSTSFADTLFLRC